MKRSLLYKLLIFNVKNLYERQNERVNFFKDRERCHLKKCKREIILFFVLQ